MARLRILPFIGLGIMLALAVLPQTRWIVLNDLDYLSGGWIHHGSIRGWTFDGNRDRIFDPDEWQISSKEDELAVALARYYEPPEQPVVDPEEDFVRRFRPIKAYCAKNPHDKHGWAHLIRIALHAPLRSRDSLAETAVGRVHRIERHAAIAEAVRAGEKVDADNAYFLTVRAALLESQGSHIAAQEALRAASQKRFYNDYAVHEGEIKRRAIEGTWGYRGNVVTAITYASIVLPHYTSLRKQLPQVVRTAGGHDPEAQLSLVRVLDKMVRDTDSIIAILVAKSIFKEAISGEADAKATENRDELIELSTAELDRELDTNEFSSLWNNFANLPDIEERFAAWAGENQAFFEREIKPPYWSSLILLAMILVMPMAFVASGVSRLKRGVMRNRVENPFRWLIVGTVFVLSIAWLALPLVSNAGYVAPWSQLVGAIAVTSLLFLPVAGARPLVLVGLMFCVLTFVYLGLTLNGLRADRRMGEFVAGFEREADLVRENWK